jgi:hypothetical protein
MEGQHRKNEIHHNIAKKKQRNTTPTRWRQYWSGLVFRVSETQRVRSPVLAKTAIGKWYYLYDRAEPHMIQSLHDQARPKNQARSQL